MKKLVIVSAALLLGFTSCKKNTHDPVPVFKCGDNVTYGSNKHYKTIQIGDQCWFAENLNIGNQILKDTDPSDNNTIEKYCYEDNEANCADFGGLYKWDEVMGYTTEVGGQGICPEGWHVPSAPEFGILFNTVGDDVNKLLEGGESGFEAKKAGFFQDVNNTYQQITDFAYFTTSTEINDVFASRVSLGNNDKNTSATFKTYGYSVRCIKN